MVEKIINQLVDCSDQELDLIARKAYAVREERRNIKIKELKENFFKAWEALEKMGVDIYVDDEIVILDNISFG